MDSPAELHDILNSLPFYPFMEIDVTALCRHPGALEPVRNPVAAKNGKPRQYPAMNTAKELMLGYINGTAEQSGALFAATELWSFRISHR